MNINELPEIDFTQIPCWDELCKILRQFEKAAPELVRLDTIGKSAQGRELLLITLTDFSTGNPDDRPALFFQEGLHAAELTVLSCSFIKKLFDYYTTLKLN